MNDAGRHPAGRAGGGAMHRPRRRPFLSCIGRLGLAGCLLLFTGLVRAGIADAPGTALEVSLITYGPGETYWERFGHDAIELRDRMSGEAVNFNYGVFDFDESGFLLNFARGRMTYRMDAVPSDEDIAYYRDEGRSVLRQRLALDAAQAAGLRDFLLWNLRPENARYAYDYFTDNCTTRVRDALDRALGGALHRALAARPGGPTYRQQTDRLMRAQPALMLLLDLGLGPYADRPLDAWQASFLPQVLAEQLRAIALPGPSGAPMALVRAETSLAAGRIAAADEPPDLRPPLALAGLALAALLLLARRRWPTGFAVLATLYLLAAGIVGVLLLALWTLTAHRAAWANANILLFSPLALALLATPWRVRRGLAPTGLAQTALTLQLVAALIAVLLHLLPGPGQQNQPWLLFALPCWLALAWLTRRPAAVAAGGIGE